MNLAHVTSGPVATFMSTLNSNFDAISAPSAIDTDNLNTGAVTTTKIGDGAVTESKIGNGGVTTTKISDGSVTTAKMTFPTIPSNPQAYTADVQKWSKFIGNLSYPVGSYYWSNSPISPENIFGGTWEQVKDRFVLAVGNTYTSVGATSGSSTVTLTKDQMPQHRHRILSGYRTDVPNPNIYNDRIFNHKAPNGATTNNNPEYYDNGFTPAGSQSMSFLENTGGNQPHENMPPYITAYCWRRTALADMSNA